MAGTTYANLTTDIRNYTEVDSDVLTAAVINRFIEDAEFRIYQELPMDSQRFVQEGNLSTDWLKYSPNINIFRCFNDLNPSMFPLNLENIGKDKETKDDGGLFIFNLFHLLCWYAQVW